jgi:TfoX/Sxy family transcriptional regulator of competence genes
MTRPSAGDPTGELIDRIRALLSDDELREVRMFGVTAVMVNNAMAVAVGKDGSLLVRVDPAEDAALLSKPGTSRAEMGTGRSMGAGWIRVDADAVRAQASLVEWVEAATRFLERKSGH